MGNRMRHWQKSSISAVFLMIMLVFAYRQTLAPTVRAGSELDFSALTRHVSIIARKPHPIGSIANRETRDYIVSYFESLGLETEVQKTTVVYRHPTRSAHATVIGFVENVIARLPGSLQNGVNGQNDLVVMAHYDSRPLTPGAADDASGTASIMEAARIMTAGPAPVHDVIFLITDGEEMGLLGAQGFFRQHPAAQRVGLVLNFEARGSYGASYMFETTGNNEWLIDGLIESVPDLQASSLSYEVYRRMANDTDMSISKGEGIPGLNFAYVAGLFDYHNMTDSVENLDMNTFAQQANYVLASAQYFANLEDWQATEGEPTYFNLWRGVLVSYSRGLAVTFGLIVLLLGAGLFVNAKRAAAVSWASTGSGFMAVLIMLLMIYSVFENLFVYVQKTDAGVMRLNSLGEWPLLAFFFATLGFTLWFPNRLRRGLSRLDVFAPSLVLVFLNLLAGRHSVIAFVPPLLLIPLMMLVSKRMSRPDLWTAALWVWCLLTAVVLYLAPNASFLLVWPLASVLLGIVVYRKAPRNDFGAAYFLYPLVFSFIPLLLLPPVYILIYLALGLPQILMILCALTLLLVWPLTRSIGFGHGERAGLMLFIIGGAMTAIMVFGRGFDTRHPRGEELFYAIDADQQQGFWASSDTRPESWLDEFMGDRAGSANMSRIMPGNDQEIRIRETELPEYQAVALTVNSDRVVNGMREMALHLQPAVSGEQINLLFAADAGISAAMVNGFPVKVPDGQKTGGTRPEMAAWWRWRLYGLPEEGADVVVTLATDRPLPIKIVEVNYGVPVGALARPENSIPRKYTWSDSTVIFQTVVLE